MDKKWVNAHPVYTFGDAYPYYISRRDMWRLHYLQYVSYAEIGRIKGYGNGASSIIAQRLAVAMRNADKRIEPPLFTMFEFVQLRHLVPTLRELATYGR